MPFQLQTVSPYNDFAWSKAPMPVYRRYSDACRFTILEVVGTLTTYLPCVSIENFSGFWTRAGTGSTLPSIGEAQYYLDQQLGLTTGDTPQQVETKLLAAGFTVSPAGWHRIPGVAGIAHRERQDTTWLRVVDSGGGVWISETSPTGTDPWTPTPLPSESSELLAIRALDLDGGYRP